MLIDEDEQGQHVFMVVNVYELHRM